jgi:hypothetical protein
MTEWTDQGYSSTFSVTIDADAREYWEPVEETSIVEQCASADSCLLEDRLWLMRKAASRDHAGGGWMERSDWMQGSTS